MSGGYGVTADDVHSAYKCIKKSSFFSSFVYFSSLLYPFFKKKIALLYYISTETKGGLGLRYNDI